MKYLKRFALSGIFMFLAAGFLAAENKEPGLGSLEGVIKVTAPPRAVSAPADSSAVHSFYDEDDASAPRHTVPEEIVVYLEDVPGDYPPPQKHVQLDQKFLQFTHRVLPVLKGTVVDFTNRDPVYHNVFSSSQTNKFDLGRKSKGERASVRVKNPEVPLKVYCEIHSSMKSNILVLDNPFFTTVKPGQNFKMEGIPPGTYTLKVWHDYWMPVEKSVTVEKGVSTKVEVVLAEVGN